MGNCIRKDSSMQWAGEDWGECDSSLPSTTRFSGNRKAKDHRRRYTNTVENGDPNNKLATTDEFHSFTTSKATATATATEVKIKITRKQLEELLSRADANGLSVPEVLAQLMNVSDHRYESHQRSWKPALQSIPEIN